MGIMKAPRFAAAALIGLIGFGDQAQAEKLTIGTGSAGGVYIALGKAICDAAKREIRRLDCKAVQSRGSLDNLIGMKNGTFDIGIVQSDIQYQAVKGTGTFEKIGALPMMKAMFSAHAEALAILARRDSGIRTLDDLPGKVVDIGKVTSGTNATMRFLFGAKGWSAQTFKSLQTLDVKEMDNALCRRQVDATAYLAGHPNAVIRKLIAMCDADFVQVTGPDVDRLIAANPYSIRAVIPREDYDRISYDVNTIGLLATVMTSDRADPALIYAVTKAVFEQLSYVRSAHASFRRLHPLEMARRGITAPYHPGAERYLKEVGRL